MVSGDRKEAMPGRKEKIGRRDKMSVPGYEEWALKEMEELGMNEIEYCNYKGCNIDDILEEPRDDEQEDNDDDFWF